MRRFDIPLDAYALFCTIARNGSITRAAKALHITQPSASMALAKLENRLGCSLFIRGAKGVTLTRDGELFYAYIGKAMGMIDVAEEKFEQLRNLEAGEIAIGASDTLSSGFLLPYLKRYNEEHPGIALRVTNRTTGETLSLLETGGIDFGFVNLPVAPSPQTEVLPCMVTRDVLVGGNRYAPLAREGLKLSELGRYPLLVLERASNTRRFLDDWAAGEGHPLRPRIELGSSDLLAQFAGINLGLAFVVREFIGGRLDSGELFEIPLHPAPPPRGIALVRRRDIPFSYAARAFMDMFTGINEE